MLAAGFETTSTALGYCAYRLAVHHDIQEKIYQEVVQNNLSECQPDENSTNKFKYLDAFVREVLRMHPIAVQPVHRRCTKDTWVDKYYIQKGFTCSFSEKTLYILF